MSEPSIVVLCGGTSEEREVSLVSGETVYEAVRKRHPARLVRLEEPALPDGHDAASAVIFPALHGSFGEDGELQAILEARGFSYAGSDAAASRLCIDKLEAKNAVREHGVALARDFPFVSGELPTAREIEALLGEEVVLKPRDKGSSVGLLLARGRAGIREALDKLAPGRWLAEERISGRELTVGIVGERALGVVEVIPGAGIYDYEHKYTEGRTRYVAPAPVDEAVAREVRETAERVFLLCGCRDFARVDFILEESGVLRFLEVNTIPGMTPTSLLPKSAGCEGIGLEELVARMLAPAVERYKGGR